MKRLIFLMAGALVLPLFAQVQNLPAASDLSCTQKPMLLSQHRENNEAVFTWSGNASEYEVLYTTTEGTGFTGHRQSIYTTSCRIDCSTVPEGVYDFRVRAICGTDTGDWAELKEQLLYDISLHCMDYLDLTNPSVHPQYGSFSNPAASDGLSGTGASSRHTIHYQQGETDPRTGGLLTTTPKDEVASVRLGNWRTNAQAECITFDLPPIDDQFGVLQLQYAVVMQVPGHTAEEQPRFTLELLDGTGQLLDSCGYADFTASNDMDGWNQYDDGSDAIVTWKDWTLIALNLSRFTSQDVHVRLTTKDCANGAHYGYAYFTMRCTSSSLQGTRCGQQPDSIYAPEGFLYRWYKTYDPQHKVVNRERLFVFTDPTDTATYSVDIMQKNDTACYYTLHVSSLAWEPHAEARAWVEQTDCKNYLHLSDSSYRVGFYWDAEGNKREGARGDTCPEVYWDLGAYGTSNLRQPIVHVPDEGGPFHATLYAMMDDGECVDSVDIDFQVPSSGAYRIVTTRYLCEGDTLLYDGKQYTETGTWTDSLLTIAGCDSLMILTLLPYVPDTIRLNDTLCHAYGPFDWYEYTIRSAGEYWHTVPGELMSCDSQLICLKVAEQPAMELTVDSTVQILCGANETLVLSFHITDGTASSYSIIFDTIAHRYGLSDLAPKNIIATEDFAPSFSLSMLPEGRYTATLHVENHPCETREIPLPFEIRYIADSVITQRWNDFLAVRQTAYDRYGGFTAYRWYRNGVSISGADGPQLYLPEVGLDTSAVYSVELTRASDGVTMLSCDFLPSWLAPTTTLVTVTPTYLPSHAPRQVRVIGQGLRNAEWFDCRGNHLSTCSLSDDSIVDAPQASGLYLLLIETDNGQQVTTKIHIE